MIRTCTHSTISNREPGEIAIFVFTGIVIQSRLLAEVQRTLHGIVPICSKCKKVRTSGDDPKNSAAWKEIEAFIADRTDADFSHGYCPKCYQTEMVCITEQV